MTCEFMTPRGRRCEVANRVAEEFSLGFDMPQCPYAYFFSEKDKKKECLIWQLFNESKEENNL